MTCTKLFAIATILGVIWLTGTTLTAQDKKDPQSKFEPRSSPGEGQKFLAKFVGDWKVFKTFYPREGAPFVLNGECKQVMINDGRFLQSLFTFGKGDTQTTGMGLIGFEPTSEKFTSVWTDSRSTRMSFRRSNGKFDGRQIELVGVALGGVNAARASRTVTKLEDGGKKIVHRQYTAVPDGKERVVMELELTRKAGSE